MKMRGQVSSPQATERISAVLAQLAELYDACILQYRLAERDHPDHFNRFRQERELTGLRKSIPEFNQTLRRAQASVIKRADINWRRYRQEDNAGRPRFKRGRFRTIEVDSPQNTPIRFTEGGCPVLRLKGLPTIRLRGSRKIPSDRQPVKTTITLKGKRIEVRLSYKHPIPEMLNPKEARNPLGIDLGAALSIATSGGDTYVSPNEGKLDRQIRTAQQRLSQVTSAAIATGRAGMRAVLDDQNRQVMSNRGRPRRNLVWTSSEPPKSYLQAKRLLSELHERRAGLRRDFRHRATSAVVKQAVLDGKDLIAMERLQVRNMSASARGSEEQPGRFVRQKSGLNRRILREGWGEILEMLEYKAESAGIPTVRVNAHGTSQTCAICGHRDPKSRRTQDLFLCTKCGHEDNADHNASMNIATRGLERFRMKPKQEQENPGLDRSFRMETSAGRERPFEAPAGRPARVAQAGKPRNAD